MPPRPGLNRQSVVAAAADLINAEGLEALSLARLAQKLGVKIPSLYNHVDGLAGLKRELALLSTRRLGERLTKWFQGDGGADTLLALAGEYRAFVREETGLYMAGVSSASGRGDAELETAQAQVVQVVLDALGSMGIKGDDAVHAARAWRAVVHGFAMLEAAGGFGLPYDCDLSFRLLLTDLLRGMVSRRGNR